MVMVQEVSVLSYIYVPISYSITPVYCYRGLVHVYTVKSMVDCTPHNTLITVGAGVEGEDSVVIVPLSPLFYYSWL